MSYNDIQIIADKETQEKLAEELNKFVQREFLDEFNIPPEQSFINARVTDDGVLLQYGLVPEKNIARKTPYHESLELSYSQQPIRDPEDITRHYLREVLDNVRYVSQENWREINETNKLLATEYDGRYNEKEHLRLNLETMRDFKEKGLKMFDELSIDPEKLEKTISQTENGLRWIINEYRQDHPDMKIYFDGPYQQSEPFVTNDLKHDHWRQKYPELIAVNTLLSKKDEKTVTAIRKF